MKNIYKSRTVILAIIMGILGVLETQFPAIQSFISSHFSVDFGTLYAVVFGSIMVVMRIITTQPIKDK